MGAVSELLMQLVEDAREGDCTAHDTLVGDGWGHLVSRSFGAAADYLRRGFSVVPQLSGAKMPCVKWKEFQQHRVEYDQLCTWYNRWPEAGVAVILGPVSGLFVIDVDGQEAHEALLGELGRTPRTPTARSGSRKPYRYHLFFKHPDAPTNAKFTPWHPKLEFRGKGGIVIAPPSLHKSGHCYTWAKGRGLDDVDLAEVPEPILLALRAKSERVACSPIAVSCSPLLRVNSPAGLAYHTRLFLEGEYANAVGSWNTKLYNAACDLAGNGIPKKQALQWLLTGAAPRSEEDRAMAIATIESAYSRPRSPARAYQVAGSQQTKPIRLEPQ